MEINLETIDVIHAGDVARLQELLDDNPGLATSRLGGIGKGRSLLHVVTDWPGYFPNGPQVASMLIEAGADVNDRGDDGHDETPLHWTASSDDAEVARVIIHAGADIEAPDGSIGTPLDNAIGYSCWHVARLLVASGARVDAIWHAAALGLLERLEELLANDKGATPEKISQGFWHACAAGQRRAAELLLDRGADLNWEPDYANGTPLDAARGHGTRRSNVIEWLTDKGARSAEQTE